MPESQEDHDGFSVRSRVGTFLNEGLQRGYDELLKEKLKLEHQVGLGHQPNVIPAGSIDIKGDPRTVEVGWHPVAGFAGKWFAEKTGLGKSITEGLHRFPDPTQHWAVLVGEYVHELWMDENLDVIYINEKIDREEWHTFEVGKTRFNDEALRQAGEAVIYQMRQARPAYNLVNNNCQNFAIQLLDVIQLGAHRKFATIYAVYQRAIGPGTIKELFITGHPDEEDNAEKEDLPPQGTVRLAEQVMDEHTKKLDDHRSIFRFD